MRCDISFFAIAFANYVEMADDFKQSFADWLKVFSYLDIIICTRSQLTRLSLAKNRDLDVGA